MRIIWNLLLESITSENEGEFKRFISRLESENNGSDAFVEAIKGVRRMPRYREATKDVSGCEKYRRAAKKALTR